MELITPSGTENLIRDLVHERTGILYADEKINLLLDKLTPLVIEHGFQSFLDYYYLLKYDEHAADEWRVVVNTISVQETFFWREMDQIHSLVNLLIPEWVKHAPNTTLKIWSSACATGEEPLTIAMALAEKGWFSRVPIEIHATDVSSSALRKAKAGVFRERAFRNLPAGLRAKYFAKEGDNWRIDPTLHSRVCWGEANLVNRNDIVRFADAPFIFCRNVFIYFSHEMIRRVVKAFADYAENGTHLFVGVAESLLQLTNEFDLIDVGNAFVYKLAKSPGVSRKFNRASAAFADRSR